MRDGAALYNARATFALAFARGDGPPRCDARDGGREGAFMAT
jgi:hypothetical protein